MRKLSYLFSYLNFFSDQLQEISYKMIGKAGVCELSITEDKINVNFVATQAQEVMDTFSIIKN